MNKPIHLGLPIPELIVLTNKYSRQSRIKCFDMIIYNQVVVKN